MYTTVFYQIDEDSWQECDNIAIASQSVNDTDRKWLPHLIINVQPNKIVSFSIEGEMLMRGTCGRSREARTRPNKSCCHR